MPAVITNDAQTDNITVPAGADVATPLPQPTTSTIAEHCPAMTAQQRRRAAILDATLAVAAEGGYDAVQMRTVARRADIAVGTLYRHFPSKVHLLVSALSREFERLDTTHDWTALADTPRQRLGRLIARLHHDWHRNPALTEAMTRAFVFADDTAAAELDRVAHLIETMLARALSGGEPTATQRGIAHLICDVWLVNLTAWSAQRISAAEVCTRLDTALRLLVGDDATVPDGGEPQPQPGPTA